jgi:hypothetical protein
MARVMIVKKNGTKTPYFWLDKESDHTRLTVYKKTAEGIKRMKGVHFDAVANRMHKH